MNTDSRKQTRNTIQRTVILDTARSMMHPTADDVYAALHEKYPTISRGTVYRNLKLLTELGQLSSLGLSSGADHYDSILKSHCHIECRICGKIVDVEGPSVSGLQEQIKDAHGFEIEGHQLVFTGTCPDCKKTIK